MVQSQAVERLRYVHREGDDKIDKRMSSGRQRNNNDDRNTCQKRVRQKPDRHSARGEKAS